MSVDERATVGAIFRLTATLALVWHVPPQTVLLFLAAEAPDTEAFGELVSRSWNQLPASQRATLNALATEAAA